MSFCQNAIIPEWVLFHIPHDSVDIPCECRELFVIPDDELQAELVRMTDLHTCELFAGGVSADQTFRFPVSRLLVDPERFPEDQKEPMAAKGQGVIYDKMSDGRRLKRKLSAIERRYLMERYYFPHHERLTAAVHTAISRYGRALIVDCHSFSSVPLPLEPCQNPVRPQICIGTDAFHTPPNVTDKLCDVFSSAGLSFLLDEPFAGSLSPMLHYRHEKRVASFMLEVRRDLYEYESTGRKKAGFGYVAEVLRRAVSCAAEVFARH